MRPKPHRWVCVNIPSMEYEGARRLQLQLLEERTAGKMAEDVLLLLEHPPVFTLGRRGGREHLKVDETFLAQHGIPVVRVERGGKITYHGPGQLVGYPIVDLRRSGWKVVDFVGALEEVMIRTAADWGIQAERNPVNRGAWVRGEKIGSVGIAVRRGVSFHGFALNVNTNLEHFGWIDPCGLRGIRATSMERIIGEALPMSEVRRAVMKHVEEVFGVELESKGLGGITGIMRKMRDRGGAMLRAQGKSERETQDAG